MSATEIIKELHRLSEAERRTVLNKLRELVAQDERSCSSDAAAQQHMTESDRMKEETGAYPAVDLHARGIGKPQAADLSARLKTFAEDWNRPEASIYDENSTR